MYSVVQFSNAKPEFNNILSGYYSLFLHLVIYWNCKSFTIICLIKGPFWDEFFAARCHYELTMWNLTQPSISVHCTSKGIFAFNLYQTLSKEDVSQILRCINMMELTLETVVFYIKFIFSSGSIFAILPDKMKFYF